MSAIRFENVAKRFGATEVISGLNLEIREGELMVLVGPSGCAKSTTLRMIAGLERISGGALYIGGHRANDLSPRERNVAMVFQSYALFPNMTVRGNLSFGMQIRGENAQTVTDEVARVAALLGLTPYLERKPKALSGGQAQRVALGRALIRRPAVFLFDEPLSNLDAELRVQMRSEITQLQRNLGTTTVYVTHDQTEAMTMGDRVTVMNHGRVMQVGTPLELYTEPCNRFVAGFIGSPKMNFIDMDARAVRELLPSALGNRIAGACIVGVRPERLMLDAKTDASRCLTLDATLVHQELLGHETLAQLAVARPECRLTARLSGDIVALDPGGTHHVHIDFDHLYLFDPQSGERLS